VRFEGLGPTGSFHGGGVGSLSLILAVNSLPSAGPWPLTLPLLMQTYDIQASLQKDSQVTVSIILENQSSSFLKNMELNVLDSLNTKMTRPEGSSVHDGVPVPFQLPPGEPTLRP
jgi:hypothetical protein